MLRESTADSEGGTIGDGRSSRTSVRERLIAVLVGTALVGIALVGTVVAIVPVLLVVPDLRSSTFLIASLIATELAFLAVGLVYVLWRLDRSAVVFRPPTRGDLGWITGGLIATLGVALGLTAVGRSIGVETTSSVLEPYVVADPFVLLILGALSVFLVAPAEELLFRGAIQTRLRRAYGQVLTVCLSSLLFASIHVLNFVGGPGGVLFATTTIFGVGLVLETVYERTHNLAVPVLVHGLYNAALFGVSYAALTVF